MKNSVEREQARKALAEQLTAARVGTGLSIPELSAKTGISQQHLRRLEDGTNEPGALMLSVLARALNCDLNSLVPDLQNLEERVQLLWRQHGLDQRLPGTESAPLEARRQILRSMGLLDQPVPATVDLKWARVPILPNREALSDIIIRLPDNTKTVRFMGVSLQSNIGQNHLVRSNLARLMERGAVVQFLLLNPASTYVKLRASEDGSRASGVVRARIEAGLKEVSGIISKARVKPEYCVRLYDRRAIWRLLLLEDRVYVSHYSSGGDGSISPVYIFERDALGASFYGAFADVYEDYWMSSGPRSEQGEPDSLLAQIREGTGGTSLRAQDQGSQGPSPKTRKR